MNLPPIQLGTGPLQPEQQQAFNQLVGTMNPTQMAWLCGYISGVSRVSDVGAVSPSVSGVPTGTTALKATILYGSQTGNGEAIASDLDEALKASGIATDLKDMVDYKPQQLKNESLLFIVASTHGEGDPPDTAMDFHAFLYGKRAPKLQGTRFAVLALGDSSYEFYCKTGEDFDTQLQKIGGDRLLDRVDCDLDYEDLAEAWVKSVVESVKGLQGETAAAATPALTATGAVTAHFDKKHPFPAPLLERINLNGAGSAKETIHLELSLEGSGLVYEPGDALGVLPSNDPEYVEELLKRLGADGETKVTTYRGEEALRQALFDGYEITKLTRPFLRGYAELAGNAELTAVLDDKDKLNEWMYGREIIDVLVDFPVASIVPVEFLELLRKLPPRLYSIASSLTAHPDEVHLTVGITRYESHGRKRQGVCTTFLADRVDPDGSLRVYIDKNKNFKLPASVETPVIMIGPGTGIAPFRAFVEEREELGGGRNWLFFGDQHFDTDFLYQTEWQQWLKSGVLEHMDVAFSRDQAEKVYVQDRMRERAVELYQWLEAGAHFYVCGDESRMAHDVHEALIEIVAAQGGIAREDAETYVKQLQKDRRYQRDVY